MTISQIVSKLQVFRRYLLCALFVAAPPMACSGFTTSACRDNERDCPRFLDAGNVETPRDGSVDSGAGSLPNDAGGVAIDDAGSDAGSADAGPFLVDAGTVDSGATDAGTPTEIRYGQRFVQFATLRKTTDDRTAYIRDDAYQQLQFTGNLPVGTLFLLELKDRNSLAPEYVAYRRKDAAGWAGETLQIGGNTSAPMSFNGGIGSTCNSSCHQSAKEDLSYTLQLLKSFLISKRPRVIDCLESNGWTPCARAEVYVP
jgi:hypothetical protein